MQLPTTNGACSQPEYIITVSYSESELPTDLSISYTRTEYECIIYDILLYDFAPRRSVVVVYYYYALFPSFAVKHIIVYVYLRRTCSRLVSGKFSVTQLR